MGYPLGASNDPSAPYNEVGHSVSAVVTITRKVFFNINSRANIGQEGLEELAIQSLKEEYGDSLIDYDDINID